MSPEFVPSFVERLQWGCSLDVSTAREGAAIDSGRVLVAPGGCHMAIARDGDTQRMQARLSRKASAPAVFSSIDRAMESAARAYGEGVLGVLLTGIGSDGAKGMQAIKEAGGSTIAEHESSCVVFGMPRAAIGLGCVDAVVPLPQIAAAILRMI
jgi:two-component system chemotaxis response regulator CheB